MKLPSINKISLPGVGGKKLLAAMAAVVVVVAAVLVGKSLGGESSGGTNDLLIIPRSVEKRSLEDILNVSGEVRRDETKKINSPVDGQISDVAVEDGDTVNVGNTIFSLNGRASVAVPGEFAFYRSLDVGDVGPDVTQLERILVAAGTVLTRADDLYTEETRAALAQWQQIHDYPAAVPSDEKTITVSLGQNQVGYSIGSYNSIAYVITPAASSTSSNSWAEPSGISVGMRTMTTTPVINITSSASSTNEGGSVTWTITADPAPSADLTVNLQIQGSATGGARTDSSRGDDYNQIRDSIVIPAGQTSVTITRSIFTDRVIEDEEDIEVSVQQQSVGSSTEAYTLGNSTSARVVIPENGGDLRRVLTIQASASRVDEGGQLSFTVNSSIESNQPLDFYVSVSGSTSPNIDYVRIDQDDLQIPANSTSATFNVNVRVDNKVEVDETLIVTLVADPTVSAADQPYEIGTRSSASVVISSRDLPELTISGGGLIPKGGSATFTISADANLSEDTSVSYNLSGSAQPGVDYKVLSGVVVIPAGARSVTVTISTLKNGVIFQPSDMLVANWPSRIGSIEVKSGEFVLQGTTLFNLTEPEFTVVMNVSPTDRAKLAVNQAAKVNFNSGETILEGVVGQLDDTPTVDETGNSFYEGKVSVNSNLESVDGAKVSIDIILQLKENVLAVPVAAVLRAADGDEVRVVTDDGKLTRVKVEIGLIDGEWAEIISGLKGDELVVIDVDPSADISASD
jgi:hypothetical protein